MKKVLVIVYYWPPSGGAGVQRWLKFVKYLPQFGWQPTVITTTNGEEDFLGEEAAIANDVYITYIDKVAGSDPETFAYVYNASGRKFVIKARDGGVTPIKEYISSGTMTVNGGNTTVIRTTDE